MRHYAEDEDDQKSREQCPKSDLLSQRGQPGLCLFRAVSAEHNFVHQGNIFVVC